MIEENAADTATRNQEDKTMISANFDYRYNTQYFADKNAAYRLFRDAEDEILGIRKMQRLEDGQAGEFARSFGDDGVRSVSIGRSCNGQYFVSMKNIDAPVKDYR